MKAVTTTADKKAPAMLATYAFDFALAPMLVIANDGSICLWNKAADRLFDKTKTGFLQFNLPVQALFEERSSSLLTDIIVSASGAPLSVKLSKRQIETQAVKRSVTVQALTDAGRVTHYLLTIGTNIPILASFRKLNSQLKETNSRAAAQRQRLKEIEVKNQELEQFSISTAHDLKAPLIQVQMLLEFLVGDHGNALDKDALDLVEKACSSVDNLRLMIDELLGDARDASVNNDSQLFSLDQSVDRVIRSMDAILSSIDAQISVPSSMGVVQGNDVQFRQVLSNILSNAIKFRAHDRQLSISIELTTWQDKPTLMRISDNGIGFDSANSESLFEPFQRLKQNPTEGHGVGLSTCRRVCEKQGWTLEASGSPGQGAEFRIGFNNSQLPRSTAS